MTKKSIVSFFSVLGLNLLIVVNVFSVFYIFTENPFNYVAKYSFLGEELTPLHDLEYSLEETNSYLEKYGESISQEKYCGDEEFWSKTDITLDHGRGNAILRFPSVPLDVGVESIEVLLLPIRYEGMSRDYNDRGFFLYNSKEISLSNERKISIFPIDFIVSEYLQDSKSNARADIQLRAYNTRQVNSKDSTRLCWEKNFTTINIFEFGDSTLPSPYFLEEVFQPYEISDIKIETFEDEIEYFESLLTLKAIRSANKYLPKPNEEALALVLHDYNYDDDFIGKDSDRWEWSYYFLKVALNYYDSEIVFGMFGNPEPNDIKTLSKIMGVLHLIAPEITVKYSSDPSKVTLPIHYFPCDWKVKNPQFKCSEWIGVYYPSTLNPGREWIWIDSTLSSRDRSATLYHEIGHSLGLPHNRCYSSSMSYEADHPTWTALDLMMLNVLYNPLGWGARDFSETWMGHRVEDYDLDREKLLDLNKEPWEACTKLERGWEELQDYMHDKGK